MTKLMFKNLLATGLVASTVIAVPATSLAATFSANSANSDQNTTSLNKALGEAQKVPASSSEQQQCGAICQAVKSAGANEISRRLTSLNNVSAKINAAAKLSASDKAYLSSQVTGEINGLTSLQTKLANDSTLNSAVSDAQSIYSDYRVYALILPKVMLVKTADDQKVTESQLSDLASKLQARISADSKKGENVATLQTELNNMTAEISNAGQISNSIEQKVLTLQPSDWNADHQILSGDLSQLKTAHGDNQNAAQTAKTIIAGLKTL